MYRNKFSKFKRSKNELKNNEEKKVLSFKEIKLQMNITIFSICMVVLITLGSSYAAFVWSSDSTVTQDISTGDYSIIIDDTSPTLGGIINLASAYPISDSDGEKSIPYKFTIKNNSSITISYNLKLIDDSTIINSHGCSSNLMDKSNIRFSMSGDKKIPISFLSNLSNSELDSGILNAGESKTYQLRLWIRNDAPNTAIGKHYHGKLQLDTEQKIVSRNTTLVDAIKKDNNAAYIEPGLVATSEMSNSQKGFFRNVDADGATYYYRGYVDNNYVKLDGLKWSNDDGSYHKSGTDMMWRIIRINGDNTVRLITDGIVGTSAFNSSTGNDMYVGYTYNNGTNSTIKTYLENWYSTTMTSFDKYVQASRFCNDTTYGASSRLNSAQPSLICPTTDKSYGGEYNLKVGLISLDEIAFAGTPSYTHSQNYLNDVSSISWWTLSPGTNWYGTKTVHSFYPDGDINDASTDGPPVTSINYGVRPVINLKSSTPIVSGTGTKMDPYIIKSN